jgi:DNA mismatch repair protein MutL
MNHIHILDESTINKIAAGEVVERPASIIKELIENSIDADSTAITIEIREGGKSYIRVADNGRGMSFQDARMSFERHATSKISSVDDLQNIDTLGFRGEALASIAAVTQMEMITRERDSLSGIHIVNHGGKIISEKEIGCPEGTTIITRNLFFNTPARLKFLKSSRTETAYISDLIGKLILAHPEISFRYINNGRTIYYSTGDGKLQNAILSIYGKDVVDQIIPIKPTDTTFNIKLWGYLGKPSLARKNRNYQSFFINGRYIKSSLLAETIEAAYKPYLTVNLFPWIILHIEINPSTIDVNVHPAKIEVRFREEEQVRQFIYQQISKILRENPYIPELNEGAIDTLVVRNNSSMSIDIDEGQNSEQLEVFSSTYATDTYRFSFEEPLKNVYILDPNKSTLSSKDFEKQKNHDKNNTDIASINHEHQDNNITSSITIPFKIVGKIFSTYIVVESKEECFLVDQHAAHERLLFEKYKKLLSEQAVMTQQLLPPVIIEVTHEEQIIINESMDLFESLGFEIEVFGGRSYAIRGVPMVLGRSNVKEFFRELLDNIEVYKPGDSYMLKIDDIIRMSCKAAVKAGDKLSEREILALLKDLIDKNIPLTCPHGRPIMISLTKNQLEKMFKRIQ